MNQIFTYKKYPKIILEKFSDSIIAAYSYNEEIYFVTNQQNIFREDICNFRVGNRTPELWNAETGQTEQIASWQTNGEQTSVSLKFQPEESYFNKNKKGA